MATTTRLEDAARTASETVKEAGEYAGRATERVRESTERVREQLGTTERRAREILEEYPLTCFFGAVVAGYLVGRIASRA